MENIETGKQKTGAETGTGTVKITITSEGGELLDQMVRKTNEGFSGGRVTRQDLASWIICHFEKHHFSGEIESIRSANFDRLTYLESVLTQAKRAKRGGAEIDLSEALSGLFSSRTQQAKKSKKNDEPSR
jgi:Fe-S cluster assembly ATPase SufC